MDALGPSLRICHSPFLEVGRAHQTWGEALLAQRSAAIGRIAMTDRFGGEESTFGSLPSGGSWGSRRGSRRDSVGANRARR